MYEVAALYHFAPVENPPEVADRLRCVAEAGDVRGTLLLAHEGINGTIAGGRGPVEAVLAAIRTEPGLEALAVKWSAASSRPFAKLKVRVKAEIVTMGQPDLDPARQAGERVAPVDWNALISAPDVAVIDTRNAYEVAIGSFEGAVDPGTESFRDFPAWWDANRAAFDGKRIAMFCTGGIRCEKSTAYLKAQGVEEVYHLAGGILKYLEEVPEPESLWRGGCFVFDERVAVSHGLAQTEHLLCRACRRPLEPADVTRPEFELGVQCHLCVAEYEPEDRARFRERQRQIALARSRGERHLG
ncbi:MAG: rhodanese-related sulfurtransferase [Pseudomonadota bacterium]